MVANTRKMYELQIKIREILETEQYTCDMFNGAVEAGMIHGELLDEFIRAADMPERLKEIRTLSREEIMANPYLQNLKISDITYKNIRLMKKRIIHPRTVSVYAEKRRNIQTFEQENSYFICDKILKLPGIVEGNTAICWMSVEPLEINTFKNFIAEAEGDVLLIGCGLGYVAYMLSLKKEVTSITIVDNNEAILTVFNNYILPQFKTSAQIKTVLSDGLEYLRTTDLAKFAFINVDIWRDVMDMVYTYLPCLEIEKQYPTVNFSYWLEDEFKEAIQKNILKAIVDYDDEGLILDKIGRDIVNATPINNRGDVTKLLELSDLREVLYNWYINNQELFFSLKSIGEKRVDEMLDNTDLIFKALNSFK